MRKITITIAGKAITIETDANAESIPLPQDAGRKRKLNDEQIEVLANRLETGSSWETIQNLAKSEFNIDIGIQTLRNYPALRQARRKGRILTGVIGDWINKDEKPIN